ncbi:MAG: patatin-like phospholipase family protein [Candidatus Omnitrophica bacterium]|nr:patatin-like phospholipase family protein [Candidatus Omnitrophota bacterium]
MTDSYIMDNVPIKVALALGGGGVRGLAHIGIIRALQKDIPIDMIAGISMGAIIGGYYALNKDVVALEKKVKGIISKKDVKEIEKIVSGHSPVDEKKLIMETLLTFVKQVYLMNLRVIKRWVFSGKEIDWVFNELGLDVDFQKTQIPFVCVSADLRSGKEVIIGDGNIKDAVLASVSLPGVFPPVKRGEQLLVDGGIIGSVPVDAARAMGADVVIAVGVEALVDYNKKLGNGIDIMFQADAVRAYTLSQLRMRDADFVIYPEVGNISWASFSRAEECIKAGEAAAEAIKPQLIELINKKRRAKFWKGFFSFPKYNE